MKKMLFAVVILVLCFSFVSCVAPRSFDEISGELDKLSLSLGGKVVIYMPGAESEVPETIVSLYGRAGEAPDELMLVDYAGIWYSDRMLCGDLAVFHAINATDASSIIKMCKRRANTLKSTVGVEMTIISSGHYICAYTSGIPEFDRIKAYLFD